MRRRSRSMKQCLRRAGGAITQWSRKSCAASSSRWKTLPSQQCRAWPPVTRSRNVCFKKNLQEGDDRPQGARSRPLQRPSLPQLPEHLGGDVVEDGQYGLLRIKERPGLRPWAAMVRRQGRRRVHRRPRICCRRQRMCALGWVLPPRWRAAALVKPSSIHLSNSPDDSASGIYTPGHVAKDFVERSCHKLLGVLTRSGKRSLHLLFRHELRVIFLKAAVRARESKIVGQGLVVLDMHPEHPLAARALSPEVPGIVGGHRDLHRHSAALFTDDLRPIGHSVTDWPGHRRIPPCRSSKSDGRHAAVGT